MSDLGKRKAGKKLSKFQKKAKYGGGIHLKQNPNRGPALKEDIQGVLLTTESGLEGPTIKDAYQLFNEYADKLYGEQVRPAAPEAEEQPSTAELSVAEQLQAELEGLRELGKQRPFQRRFYKMDERTRGIVLVRFTDEAIHPVRFVEHILRDLKATGVPKSRYLNRLLPFSNTCHANPDKIGATVMKAAGSLLALEAPPQRYQIVYQCRANKDLNQEEVITAIMKAVPATHIPSQKNASVFVIINVLKNAAMIGLTSEYFALDKFNIRTVCPAPKDDPSMSRVGDAKPKEEDAPADEEDKDEEEAESGSEEEPEQTVEGDSKAITEE